MPINHWLSPYTMEPSAKAKSPISTATLWAAGLCSQTAAFGFNLNNEDEEELLEEQAATDDSEANSSTTSSRFEPQLPKEPLFEKPLTPSDVGKLNRLVIPKQHAERYFPLNGGAAESGGGGDKGLLLGFEDELGKSWRFRYSYWNSSQSYVLTKGWSRFVKEKRLDAGDIVLFARHPKEVGRLFIGWRRRSGGGHDGGGVAQPAGWSGVLYPAHPNYPTHHQQLSSTSVLHQTDGCPHAEDHTRGRNGNFKRLRLFGVNLEWDEDEPGRSTPKPSSGPGQIDEDPYHGYYPSHQRTGQTVSYMFHSTNT